MPRLDEGNEETTAVLEELGVDWQAIIDKGSPIDVCMDCYRENGFDDAVEHPPYDDEAFEYECAVCGTQLRPQDDLSFPY